MVDRLAERALFEPLAPWLAQLPDGLPPSPERLNRFLADRAVPPRSGGGANLKFVAATADRLPYERHIFRTGCVPTRPGNWHDAFNALAWLRFPLAKAALNARHVQSQSGATSRGPVRDAATLFDESGVIVAGADAALADALRGHRWRELFVARRGELARNLRFIVFGHAVYDQLRTPFCGLCGKALWIASPAEELASPDLLAHLDAGLSSRFADPTFLASPRELWPLPMLGIPGVTDANLDPAYYDDERQFRPLRQPRA